MKPKPPDAGELRKWKVESTEAAHHGGNEPLSPRQRVLQDIDAFKEQQRKKHALIDEIEKMRNEGGAEEKQHERVRAKTNYHPSSPLKDMEEAGEESNPQSRDKRAMSVSSVTVTTRAGAASASAAEGPPVYVGTLNVWSKDKVCDWFVELNWDLTRQQKEEYLTILENNDIDGQVRQAKRREKRREEGKERGGRGLRRYLIRSFRFWPR